MSVYLDILFSIVIGSPLLLMILTYNYSMMETNHINNMYSSVQKNGYEFQEILRNDFRNIGLFVPDTSAVFSIADSNQVKFKSDIDMDGSVNEIHYDIGSAGSAGFTENPDDRTLDRIVDGAPAETYSIGCIDFDFIYYDENGIQTVDLEEIKQIEYRYYLESTFGYNGEYPGIYIKGRIDLKNIN